MTRGKCGANLLLELADTQEMKGDEDMVNAKELKFAIRRKGITQEELAKRTNMDPATLNKKINNKSTFTVDEAQKVANELELGCETLISIFFAQGLA